MWERWSQTWLAAQIVNSCHKLYMFISPKRNQTRTAWSNSTQLKVQNYFSVKSPCTTIWSARTTVRQINLQCSCSTRILLRWSQYCIKWYKLLKRPKFCGQRRYFDLPQNCGTVNAFFRVWQVTSTLFNSVCFHSCKRLFTRFCARKAGIFLKILYQITDSAASVCLPKARSFYLFISKERFPCWTRT